MNVPTRQRIARTIPALMVSLLLGSALPACAAHPASPSQPPPTTPATQPSASAAPGPTYAVASSSTYTTWKDERIDESSGLIYVDDTLLTTNDSGDKAVIYASQGRSGTVTGTLTYRDDEPTDVEALAWGPGRTLWIADIGDNARKRERLTLTKVVNPPLKGDHTVKGTRGKFTYPPKDRHDAEALIVHPTSGKAYLVTKEFFGAGFYEVPDVWSKDAPAQLIRRADAPAIVTDGVFSPDGTRIYLRTYTQVVVYSYPQFQRLSTVTMPRMDQGEAIANGPGGSLLLSTEGLNTPVLQVTLPPEARTPPKQAAGAIQPAAATTSTPLTWVLPAFMLIGGAILAGAITLVLRARQRRRAA